MKDTQTNCSQLKAKNKKTTTMAKGKKWKKQTNEESPKKPRFSFQKFDSFVSIGELAWNLILKWRN